VPDAPQGVVYIDTSALVKLVVREAESDALEHALPDLGELATSAITSIELARAVARARADGTAAVLAYDKRLQDAARSRGITVLAPGSDLSG